MKHNVRAFTLIELLVTVTIIAIVSAVAISPFSLLSRGMETKERSEHISDMISSLDESIEKNQASSYEAVFASGSVGFVTNQDWHGKSPIIACDFDSETGSGVLKSMGTGVGLVDIRVMIGDRERSGTRIFENGGTYPFSFPRQNNSKDPYVLSSAISDISEVPLNSFLIRYYDLPDTMDITESPTRLVSIASISSGSEYTSLTMRNINGTRTMIGSGATLDKLTKAKLVFDKNGTEMVVIIGETGQ